MKEKLGKMELAAKLIDYLTVFPLLFPLSHVQEQQQSHTDKPAFVDKENGIKGFGRGCGQEKENPLSFMANNLQRGAPVPLATQNIIHVVSVGRRKKNINKNTDYIISWLWIDKDMKNDSFFSLVRHVGQQSHLEGFFFHHG